MTGRRDRRPPALATLARRVLVEDAGLVRGDRVLCAVSGGPDSSALLHVLAGLRARLGFELAACAVDHGLRAEAAAEIELAATLAARLEVPIDVERVMVDPGGNLQARARAARHGVLREVASRRGARFIATAHTADDRAETVLLRLLRGAGPRGLAVLPPRDGILVRPLIRARRAQILAHLERHAITAATDPSNRDPRFLRVRVRQEVLPLLADLAPRIVASLCDLADDLGPSRDVADPLASLNRAQRQAIARARAQGRTTARLRITGGRDVLATIGADSAHEGLPDAGTVRMEEVSLHVEEVSPAGRRRRGG